MYVFGQGLLNGSKIGKRSRDDFEALHMMSLAKPIFLFAVLSLFGSSLGLAQEGSPAPRWFKGNLHAHSLWSDGDDYPEMVADRYRQRGYHFLVLSEHNVLSQGPRWMSVAAANKRSGQDGLSAYRKRFGEDWVETRTEKDDLQVRLKPLGEFRHHLEVSGGFLMIQGEEITDRSESRQVHYIATNLHELIKPQGGKTVRETMERNLAAVEEQAKRLGRPILAHHIHPNTGYSITGEEMAAVTRERYFEVASGHGGVNQLGDKTHVGIERMWDIINTIRIGEMNEAPARGLAADDSHNFFGMNNSVGRGWIMVRSVFLTPESIIKAIEAGDFYASTGVTLKELRYSPEARTLEVEIEPRKETQYKTRFIGTRKGYNAAREPVRDEKGKPLPVTQRYSDDVGRVLATVEGTKAVYRLTGDELYVRAVVEASRAPEKPTYQGQKAQAWSQPVGWKLSGGQE